MTTAIEIAAVRTILAHPEAYEWTIQGLGMMRLYLSDEIRLHVWDHSLAVPGVTEIHNHPWDFTSHIIAGQMTNHVYIAGARHGDYSSKPGFEPYQKAVLLCGTGQLDPIREEVWLEPWKPDGSGAVYLPGDIYYQNHWEIHRSEFVDGTVTLIVRRFTQADRDHAEVFWPRGDRFGSAEPRIATSEEVTQVSARALALFP